MNHPSDIESKLMAVLDLGSNSFHLIVARVVENSLQILHKDKQLASLATGLDEQHMLSEQVMEKALAVLQNYAVILDEFHPARVRIIATHSIREAANRTEFIRRAEDIIGFPIEVVSGNEEARLIYQGVAHNCQLSQRTLVVDIGGGSTEFALGKHFELYEKTSIALGCVTSSTRFFGNGDIRPEYVKACNINAEQLLEEENIERFQQRGWKNVIGTSGSLRAMQQYAEYHQLSNGDGLSLQILEQMLEHLLQVGHCDKITGLDSNRAWILPAGTVIAIATCRLFAIDKLRFEPFALREGVLHELAHTSESDDIQTRTIDSMIRRFHIDTAQTKRLQKTVGRMFKQTKAQMPKSRVKEFRRILDWAVQLHEIGIHINRSQLHKHSGYIVRHSDLPGFDSEQQELLAVLVTYWRKSLNVSALPDFFHYCQRDILLLIMLLRLACLLNIRRIDDAHPDFQLCVDKNADNGMELTLKFPQQWLQSNPLMVEDLNRECRVLQKNAIRLLIKTMDD